MTTRYIYLKHNSVPLEIDSSSETGTNQVAIENCCYFLKKKGLRDFALGTGNSWEQEV